MSGYSHVPGGLSSDHLDTSYQPYNTAQHHRRSQSAAAPHDRNTNYSDTVALLEHEKHAVDDLYDPHTRSGRPSFAHSTPGSPMLNPPITVSTPEPDSLALGGSRSMHSMPARRKGHGHSGWAKFLARIRWVLVALTLVLSLLVVGVNAHILVVYRNHRVAGKLVQQAGTTNVVFWAAWPKEGIDFRPITSYVGVGVYNAIAALIFLLSSVKKSFRYLESGPTRLYLVVLMSTASLVLWTLLSVFLQFQSVGNSGKHSFRTWACSHTDKSLYSIDGVNFPMLCTEATASRWAGVSEAVLNLLIVVTIILSYRDIKRRIKHERIAAVAATNSSWTMPRWGRS